MFKDIVEQLRRWSEARRIANAISLERYERCRTPEEKENFLYFFDRISLMMEDITYRNKDPSYYCLSPKGINYIIRREGRKTFEWLPKPIIPNKKMSEDKVKLGTAAAVWYDLKDGDEVEISLDGPGKVRKTVVIDKRSGNRSFSRRLQMEMYAPDLGRLYGYKISFDEDGETKEIISPYEPFYASYRLRVVERAKPKPEETEKIIKEMEKRNQKTKKKVK